MNDHRIGSSSLVLLIVAAFAPLASADDAEVAGAIKAAAPAAAAVSKEVWTKLAQSKTTPKIGDFESQPLALVILNLPISQKNDDAFDAEFKYDDEFPAASDIVKAFKPGSLFPLVTPLHTGYIRDVTANVQGDKATGEIKFAAKGVYSGKVEHQAQKVDGKWQIVEFSLPVRGVKTRLTDGKWKMEQTKK